MSNRRRHTAEQVVRKLGQADRLFADGTDVAAVWPELQISEQAYYRWRNQSGRLKAHNAKRLKELEKQNATLKRLLAESRSWRRLRSRAGRGKLLTRAGAAPPSLT